MRLISEELSRHPADRSDPGDPAVWRAGARDRRHQLTT